MPVSPLGNLHFINQNTAAVSAQVSSEAAKAGFANMANLVEFQSKEKVVDKLDKVNESHIIEKEIDEKMHKEQEKKRQNKQNNTEQEYLEQEESDEGQEVSFKGSKLDLSV